MTEFAVPLPPDDLAMVWDKDADPWMRQTDHRDCPGGVWREARTNAEPDKRTWARLLADFGPVTDYEPRCEAVTTVEDRGHFRCLLAPNHAGHHKLPPDCWTEP